MLSRPVLPAPGDRDRGSIAPMIAIVALAALILIGLAVDGGRKAQATQTAVAVADEAARAGGNAIDPAGARGEGSIAVEVGAAVAAAQAYLAAAGVDGEVTVNGGRELVVTTTIQVPTIFLDLIGVDVLTVTGSGSADLVGA